ncbi:MAG: tRNA guanosine(34) transglycosylase Tgt [Candidatus Staskawiczbacteria bacterium]|nr:tRNA guanosine(34) transglycosylase Tgt [Candidatus Staskawiczbacteria bacterium]MBI3337048.1 tRNA guanosine(34) transglycosylase Tgt [Candidatus Staskawiczbacteria bacterium]
MISFKILKKSKESNARIGFLETSHGVVETPCLVPVATQAVVKTLTSEEASETRSQILISNTFHLHLKPGEKVLEKSGGIHKFMNWKRPIMTDSGGFQVFSLGFGRDFGIGKVLKSSINNNPQAGGKKVIQEGDQPQKIKITQDGVYFQSPIDGSKLFLGPKESIKIQEKIGADIIFSFDECTPPLASYEYTKKSLIKTHNWAKSCLDIKKTNQALFGIVQGGRHKDLRHESAKFISALPFDGFGIGGEFGKEGNKMSEMIEWVVDELPEKKPRHLLGIGYLKDIEMAIKSGIDLFDCTVPTHYARRGIAFTSEGKLDLKQINFLKKREPLDKECVCNVCLVYKKDYVSHLLRAGELTAFKLLTFHNLYYFNNFVENIRTKIKKGEI